MQVAVVAMATMGSCTWAPLQRWGCPPKKSKGAPRRSPKVMIFSQERRCLIGAASLFIKRWDLEDPESSSGGFKL